MPYIVTTSTPVRLSEDKGDELGRQRVSLRAVATLDEARAAVGEILNRDAQTYAGQTMALPESGGTVGPLPDGTVIEVEGVSHEGLARRANVDPHGWMPADKVIDAYNAGQGTAAV